MKSKTRKVAGKASLDPLVLRPTSRGFLRADFRDGNGDECSIQESSAAEAPFLWLGMNTGTHVRGECMARMHLTPDNAAALIPLLRYFVRHGRLPPNAPAEARRSRSLQPDVGGTNGGSEHGA